MDTSSAINEFASNAVKNTPPNQIDTLYRMINFLCDVTERTRENVHINDRERHYLFRSLIETKQSLIKNISRDQKKYDTFLKQFHLADTRR